MSEISSAIAEAIRKRAASATLGTYLFFWAAYHWQGLYVTFFVNQDLIYGQHGLLKNEYVDKYFFGINGWNDWGFYLGILAPAMLTYLFIWLLPKFVLIHAYRQEQRHKIDRRIVKSNEEMRLKEAEESLSIQEKKVLEAEIETSEKKKEANQKDPTILWQDELKQIEGQREYEYLRDILKCIYKYKGRVYVDGYYNDSEPEFELDANSLRFGDSSAIINTIDSGNRIELTKKGKFFAARYKGEF